MSLKDTQFDRRTVLKTIGSAAVVGAGLSGAAGSAAAYTDTERRLTRAYSDESHLRAAFQQHGEGLRESLVEAGFVPTDFDFDALDIEIDSAVTGLEPKARDGLAGVTAIEEAGTTTALGMASTSSATHEVSLFVQPQREEAYAIVEPRNDDQRFIVTESDVSPSGCSYFRCGDCCYTDYAKRTQYECSDAHCQDCWASGSDCACSDTGCP